MSLVPLLFSDWWADLDRPHRIFGQDFGTGLHPEQLLHPSLLDNYAVLPVPDRSVVRNPLLYLGQRASDLARQTGAAGTSVVKSDKDKFQVVLDIHQFKPEEINVKVVDKFVVIEAKHEEKPDEHGWISRQFIRKYLIPEQCDPEQVSSSLSSDGVLSITAPRKPAPEEENERIIKIQHTGKPALQEKQHFAKSAGQDQHSGVKDTKSDEKTPKAVKK